MEQRREYMTEKERKRRLRGKVIKGDGEKGDRTKKGLREIEIL